MAAGGGEGRGARGRGGRRPRVHGAARTVAAAQMSAPGASGSDTTAAVLGVSGAPAHRASWAGGSGWRRPRCRVDPSRSGRRKEGRPGRGDCGLTSRRPPPSVGGTARHIVSRCSAPALTAEPAHGSRSMANTVGWGRGRSRARRTRRAGARREGMARGDAGSALHTARTEARPRCVDGEHVPTARRADGVPTACRRRADGA